jgi:hypothetical protein
MMAAAQQNQLIIKIDSDLMARIQRFAERLIAAQPPGIKLTRTDAIRVILHKGLDAVESEWGPR